MKRLILIVLLLVICVLVIPVTYAYTAEEQIELVKNYAISIGLGGLGAGTIGSIAYGMLKKTKDAVVAKVAEAKKQSDLLQENANLIATKLQESEVKNIVLGDKFDAMAVKFESAENKMNTLISQYQARDKKIADILEASHEAQ